MFNSLAAEMNPVGVMGRLPTWELGGIPGMGRADGIQAVKLVDILRSDEVLELRLGMDRGRYVRWFYIFFVV